MFWILHGEDEFRRSEFLSTLKDDLGDPDELQINTTLLDGRRVTLSEIVHSCSAVPFMGESRLVIIHDLLAQGARSSNRSKDNKNRTDANHAVASDEPASSHSSILTGLKEYLPNLPDSTVLVFVESQSISPRHPLRALTEGASPEGKVREFRPFSASRRDGPAQLSRWIRDRAKGKGLTLSSDVVKVLATYVGYDLRLLDQELEKLSVYAEPDGAVTAQDVRRLVPYVREADIFEMVDALGRRDTRQAIALLHMMLDEGKPPLYLLTMIVRQFRIIMQVKELQVHGFSAPESAKQLRLHEFVVKKAMSQARNFSFDQLTRIYDLLAETDTAVKTGRLNQVLALDLLIAEVTLA